MELVFILKRSFVFYKILVSSGFKWYLPLKKLGQRQIMVFLETTEKHK